MVCPAALRPHRYTDAAEECTSAAQQGDGSVGDVLRRTYDEVREGGEGLWRAAMGGAGARAGRPGARQEPPLQFSQPLALPPPPLIVPSPQAVASEGLQGERLQAFADAWHFREKLQRTFDGFFSTDDVSLAFARCGAGPCTLLSASEWARKPRAARTPVPCSWAVCERAGACAASCGGPPGIAHL